MRIRAALPTIEELRGRGARLVLVSHLGRPKDREPELSLAPVAKRLGELIGVDVKLAPGVVGEEVRAAVDELGPTATCCCSRTSATRRGRPRTILTWPARWRHLPMCTSTMRSARPTARTPRPRGWRGSSPEHAAGLLLEREVSTLMKVLEDPARPLVAVLGGAKVSDKIGVIDRFRETADTIIIGGAMCFPFLAAQGHCDRRLAVRRGGRRAGAQDALGGRRRASGAEAAGGPGGRATASPRTPRCADDRRRRRSRRLDGARHRPAHRVGVRGR